MRNFAYFLTLTLAAIFISCIAVFSRELLGIFIYLATSEYAIVFVIAIVGNWMLTKYWGEETARKVWLAIFVIYLIMAALNHSILNVLIALLAIWFRRPTNLIRSEIS